LKKASPPGVPTLRLKTETLSMEPAPISVPVNEADRAPLFAW
jgi:hypothetical protein